MEHIIIEFEQARIPDELLVLPDPEVQCYMYESLYCVYVLFFPETIEDAMYLSAELTSLMEDQTYEHVHLS